MTISGSPTPTSGCEWRTDSTETDITNATARTYTLAAEDAGKTVKVTVSFTDDADNDEGPLVSESYPATGTVTLADGNHPATGVPAITGTARVRQVLTADLSGIADEDGTTKADNNDVGFAYTYQWVQVDGSSETDITGATGSTYTLATEDAGKTVKVKVSFTDDADFDEGPLTSEAYPAMGTIGARNATIALVSNTGQPLSSLVDWIGGRGKAPRPAVPHRVPSRRILSGFGGPPRRLRSSTARFTHRGGLQRGCRRHPRYPGVHDPGVHAEASQQLHQ